MDEAPGYSTGLASNPDSTFRVTDNVNAALKDVLSRPVLIGNFSWTTSAKFSKIFDPWQCFLSDSFIEDKIKRFRGLRGTMHVKFVVNGNAFHYGSMLCNYRPLPKIDAQADPIGPHFTSGPNVDMATLYEDIDCIPRSQMPHIYLDPTTSMGGVLVCPFVYPHNFIDLCSFDTFGAYSEQSLGQIEMYAISQLKYTNGTSEIDIQVFAWMEDVELTLPTNRTHKHIKVTSIPVQSGDEYGTGVISDTANSLSVAAGHLSSVPVIGPFARISSIALKLAGGVAKLFGYSRPVVITDIAPYKPVFTGNLVNTDSADTSTKLTYDSKQEVTIDPRVVGLSGVDEMTIRHIASRETFVSKCQWTSAIALGNCVICGSVEPHYMYNDASYQALTNDQFEFVRQYAVPIVQSSDSFAAYPFNRWRGTMRYRVQIVASAFHKGRLRFSWDPCGIYYVANDGTSKPIELQGYNTLYSTVIDLAEKRSFTIDIGWGQPDPYARQDTLLTNNSWRASPHAMTDEELSFANGQFAITVLNKLVAPEDAVADKTVDILIFKSCPDLEVADPTDSIVNLTTKNTKALYDKQSGSDAGMKDTSAGSHAPVSSGPDVVFGKPCQHGQIDNVYYGDPVASFRNILKRYTLSHVLVPGCNSNNSNNNPEGRFRRRYRLPNFPMAPGPDPKGNMPYSRTHHTAPATRVISNNLSNTTLLNWVSAGYLGYRGGLRWKFVTNTERDNNNDSSAILTVGRSSAHRQLNAYTLNNLINYSPGAEHSSANARRALKYNISGNAGMSITPCSVNPVVEVEMPFFQNQRFLPTRRKDNDQRARHDVCFEFPAPKVCNHEIKCYVSAGDDFSLFWYLGAPRVYLRPVYVNGSDGTELFDITPIPLGSNPDSTTGVVGG